MIRDVKWVAGALAAALWIAPAGADDTSGSARGAPTGSASGSDTTGRVTNPNTQSGTYQERASDTGSGSAATGSSPGSTTTDNSRGLPTGSGTGSDTTGRVTNPNTQAGGAESTTREAAGATGSGEASGATASSATGAAGQHSMQTTLTRMHAGNQAEIQAGEYMKEHATNGKVKDFAKKMVDDHGKLDEDLQKFAQKNNVDLSNAASSPEMQQAQSQLDQLKGQTGAQLDREYMRAMVEDHQRDVSAVRSAEQQAKSMKGQKEYASLLDKSAKKMEHHLKDAQKIQRDLTRAQARTPQNQ